jgi:NAD-dependent histone deacetylase SIR2
MSQTVPFCPICRKNRDVELQTLKSKSKSNGKGKGKASGWGSESDEEESEWGGGEPGIMKVHYSSFLNIED